MNFIILSLIAAFSLSCYFFGKSKVLKQKKLSGKKFLQTFPIMMNHDVIKGFHSVIIRWINVLNIKRIKILKIAEIIK